ncbi:hypothetical protein [Nonomuraea rubra]|uniref:Uncharacterized protein n=1 Tax=Nonomuraea rubra TaxID=46180 RepID=A0A7X0NUD1_9ACTN|nr:hypothetical protein [Nonomuraea rubra]MBB6549770.1 hypothetical protein [Nonomuraea rubra]
MARAGAIASIDGRIAREPDVDRDVELFSHLEPRDLEHGDYLAGQAA